MSIDGTAAVSVTRTWDGSRDRSCTVLEPARPAMRLPSTPYPSSGREGAGTGRPPSASTLAGSVSCFSVRERALSSQARTVAARPNANVRNRNVSMVSDEVVGERCLRAPRYETPAAFALAHPRSGTVVRGSVFRLQREGTLGSRARRCHRDETRTLPARRIHPDRLGVARHRGRDLGRVVPAHRHRGRPLSASAGGVSSIVVRRNGAGDDSLCATCRAPLAVAGDCAARPRLDGAAIPALLDRAAIDRLIAGRHAERRGTTLRRTDRGDRLPSSARRAPAARPPRRLCGRARHYLAGGCGGARECA